MTDSWTMPAELDQPIPRRVRWGFLIAPGIFMAVLAIGFCVATAYEFLQAQHAELLQKHGITTKGTVTYLSTHQEKQDLIYTVYYQFMPAGSSDVSAAPHGSDTVSSYQYQRLAIGAPVDLVYDPADYQQSMLLSDRRLYDDAWQNFYDMTGGLLVGAAVMILLNPFVYFLRYRRERNMVANGIAVCAQILDEKDYVAKGGKYSKLTFSFVDQSGQKIDGSKSGVPLTGGSSWRAAPLAPRTLLYDRGDSRKVMFYPGEAVICEKPQ